jgi:hypothetical protein
MGVVLYPNLCVPILYGFKQGFTFYFRSDEPLYSQLKDHKKGYTYLRGYILKSLVLGNIFVYLSLSLQIIIFHFSDKVIFLTYTFMLPFYIFFLLCDFKKRFFRLILQGNCNFNHRRKECEGGYRTYITSISLVILAIVLQMGAVFIIILQLSPVAQIAKAYVIAMIVAGIFLSFISSYIVRKKNIR